ncbi:acetoin dehydrogenase dihydrolipoyllysine-residue acetyltransferase subunit [Ramlibacter monticola]|uniref:Acetoin dehydrogenase dihydrolipoyllysine-residue acetyltransferase subunit n=1 Tax=Ramlibacter monticola TaxID=1926872 RepID=A0A937CTV3_9BURK|nr:acetoin dehydrogenase dihydrolipoyllysine-residue acetyltransferase subunit [Ramlibacter monticola]MBL0393015.1 acetoin dehydrogenase dihydrolipoyllysine-residue acetyltransferase subunit [Ramlibacter monticola]
MAGQITPLVMPKWGLEMREGTVAGWLVGEGTRIEVGTPVIDVETDKISNAVEAPDPGLLRRQVAKNGERRPVKALLGVLAEAEVPDAEIDAYIAAYEVPAAGDEAGEAGPAYDWAEVDGIRVRYARRGPDTGVPVLFLHGYGGDLGNWLFNLDALSAAAPVIALDLPGHGQSDARLPGTSLADLSAFVAAFLAKIGVDRVHLVGHSMGGAIGAQLALDHPERVASLALINPAGLGPEINGDYTRGFARASSRRELKPVVEQLFATPAMASRQMVDDLLKYKRVDGVGELLDALQGALFAAGRQADLPALRLAERGLPLLVVWGAQDRVIPAAHAGNAPPWATVQVLEGAGHMAMMEKASEVNALLKRHIGA